MLLLPSSFDICVRSFFVSISDLAQVFRAVMKQHNLAPGDFPDLEPFRSKLADTNFIKFPKLKVKMLEDLDEVYAEPV